MNQEGRRLNTIHQSLVRPVLLAGAERPLAIGNWVIAAALILGVGNRYSVALGVFMATAGHWGLMQLAKADPQFFWVYIRQLGLKQTYYPARASIWVPPPSRSLPLVGLWCVMALFALVTWGEVGHAMYTLPVCGLLGAYGHWKIAANTTVKPTVPTPNQG
jgi:type IV secretion system protein TrbD